MMSGTTTNQRVVQVLSAIYFEPAQDIVDGKPTTRVRTARRGDAIDLSPDEEKRLDAAGALLLNGSKPEDAQALADARIDAYRGARGDAEAQQRHLARVQSGQSSGGTPAREFDVDGATVQELAEWIRSEKPNVDDTVGLADNDPVLAEKVLEAEQVATSGSPRSGVESRLAKLIGG
jgi:hypothetical protein